VTKKLLLFAKEKGVFPHLGLGYVASYLRKYLKYHNVFIEEATPQELEKQLKLIKDYKPDIIGFTCVTRDYNHIANLAKMVKEEMGIPIILGGQHISPIPHTLPKHIDIAVIREGEETVLEVMDTFLGRGRIEVQDLEKIDGIAYHYDGGIKINSRRRLISPLDKVPFPARDLLDMDHYLKAARSLGSSKYPVDSSAAMTSSRGCPYNCVYCSAKTFWQTYRSFSAEYVVAEIKMLVDKYHVDTININDDLFIGNRKRVKKIVELIKQEEINKKVKFWVSARANIFNEETAQLLKEMNVFHVAFGFESGSEKVLHYLKGENVTVEQNKKAALLAKKYGFRVEAGIIIGSPDETKKDMRQTFAFLKKYPIDAFGTCILTPLPGAPLWEEAKKERLVSDNMNFNNLWDFNSLTVLEKQSDIVLMTKTMSRREFFNEYKKIAQLQLERGGYIGNMDDLNLFSLLFWKVIITQPTTMLRLFKGFLSAKTMFSHPKIYRLLRRITGMIRLAG
jgi:radical SAM superfamily enzyme YgiQ (UPF0313 family)